MVMKNELAYASGAKPSPAHWLIAAFLENPNIYQSIFRREHGTESRVKTYN
jgi:hypothetical protein